LFGRTACLKGLKRPDDLWRKSAVHLDHLGSLKNDRKREDGEKDQDGHEKAALDEKLNESRRGGQECRSEDGMHGIGMDPLVNGEVVVDF
jgi:hypothetical protein